MARLIKNEQKAMLGLRLTTVMKDASAEREFKTGDIINGLRYVENGNVITVSGRLVQIHYRMAAQLSGDPKNPKDTLAEDLNVVELVLDASSQYRSRLVTVPVNEIVEFEDETDVIRMQYEPFLIYDMTMKYSDLTVQHASVRVGDIFDNVRIMNFVDTGIGPDITGTFEVVTFSYTTQGGRLAINGIVFRDTADDTIVAADLKHILALNEIYTYDLTEENIGATVANLSDGDTITVTKRLNTAGNPIAISKENITIDLQAPVIADSSINSGIRIDNGSARIIGAPVVTYTPYDRAHSTGVINVRGNGSLTFNGSGVVAVIEDDPVNKGQFGVVVTENGKLIINDGYFNAGWYCLAGNGSTTTAESVITVNGGEFLSVSDYAIYHPDPGLLVINGGTFEGAAGAIAANNGTIDISGGTFSVTGGGNTGEWSDGTGGLSNVAINLNAKYGDIVCRISGGTFQATAAGTIMIRTGNGHSVDLQISGGRFSSKPNAEWIAEGFVCTDMPNAEGFYSVVPA